MWYTLVPFYGVPANYSANAIERFMCSFINNHSCFDLLSMKIKEAARHLISPEQAETPCQSPHGIQKKMRNLTRYSVAKWNA
jgi:hypothetical protein